MESGALATRQVRVSQETEVSQLRMQICSAQRGICALGYHRYRAFSQILPANRLGGNISGLCAQWVPTGAPLVPARGAPLASQSFGWQRNRPIGSIAKSAVIPLQELAP